VCHAANETAARRMRVVCVCVARAGLRERSTQGACGECACVMRPTKQQHAGCVCGACVWHAPSAKEARSS